MSLVNKMLHIQTSVCKNANSFCLKNVTSFCTASHFYSKKVAFMILCAIKDLGPAAQSIVNLMSLFRGQLVKCFMTLQPNTLIFFVEKMREAFAVQKLITFFQQKISANFRY